MKRVVLFLAIVLLLCGCAATQVTEETVSVEIKQQISFYEGDLQEEKLTSYSLEKLQEFFPYSSAVENTWCGAADQFDTYNYPDVEKAFPGGVLRKYEYTTGKFCKYSVYKVDEGGRFYIFWDTIRGSVQPGFEELPELWSSTMLYVPELKSRSDFDSIQNGVSTGADVTAIDPGAQFIFTLSSRTPSWHLLEDGSVLEIQYEIPEDCGCNYTRQKLVVTEIIQYAPGEMSCALSQIDPTDMP